MADKEVVLSREDQDIVDTLLQVARVDAGIVNEFHDSLSSDMDITLKNDLTNIFFFEVVLGGRRSNDSNDSNDE